MLNIFKSRPKIDPLPLSNVPTANILQILKKCNDESFTRSIGTCRRLNDAAGRLEKKSRIFTHSYLAIFVYFDEEEEKIYFDVPYSCKREKPSYIIPKTSRFQFFKKIFKKKEPPEVTRAKSDVENEEERHLYLGNPPKSQLLIRRSNRKRAFHRKMTVEQLGHLLEFFKFNTVVIDPNNDEDDSYPHRITASCHRKRFTFTNQIEMAEEVLKLFGYIRAGRLHILGLVSEDLCQRTVALAREIIGIKELAFRYPYGEEYRRDDSRHPLGLVEKLKTDWYSLQVLDAQCLQENLEWHYNDLIKRWETGQTSLKFLRLHIANWDHDYSPNFQNIYVFLKMPAYRKQDIFHYVHSLTNNRWAITHFCFFARIFFFHDITDCDGCNCSTDFCFIRLLEVITPRIYYRAVVDWGPVLERWNLMGKEKTMENLGYIVSSFIEPRYCQATRCCC